MISVVIPVRDGGEGLRRMLEAIREQNVNEEVEVVVVDSGSTDGSQDLASSFGARVQQIAPEDFNHGATRNLGASLARGEIIVFTVQDALPVGNGWLETLTAPLRQENRLAGTYSRQIAYDHAPSHQRRYIDFRYGPNARVQRASSPEELTVATTLFSNVSSAIRRGVIERFPLAENMMTAEDLEWCGRVLLAGYEVAYVPGSVVMHSHRYTLGTIFRRYFDQGVAAKDTVLRGRRGSSRALRGEGLRFVRGELARMWRDDERGAIPRFVVYDLTRYAGFLVGTRYRLIPMRLRRRWSGVPSYWS